MLGAITSKARSGQRTLDVGSRGGPTTIAKKLPPYTYQRLRPHLPERGFVELNDVESSIEKCRFDDVLPSYLTTFVPTDDPSHEALYVGCLREHVDRGESVVVVGGGEGVSTVVAARRVGEHGCVTTFEGGQEEVAKTRETVGRNDVDDRVTVEHAIVSKDYSLRSSGEAAAAVAPSALPVCDTLAIDADGAELPILEDLAETPNPTRPDRLVVEHHAVLDDGDLVLEYEPAVVRELISALGYEIVEERAHPTRAYGRFEERIFVAER